MNTGSEPSASDVEKAVKTNITQLGQFMFGGLPQAQNAIDAIKVKKLGCAQAQGQPSSSYTCDVETVDGNGVKNTATIHLVKRSDGWAVAQ